MKTFLEMKNNVGNDLQDTSSAMAAFIGRYINKRYVEVLRTCNVQPINMTHMITIANGTALSTLPTDFGKELYCVDGTNNNQLQRIDPEEITQWDATIDDTNTDPETYSILRDNNGALQINLHPAPAEDIYLKLPYMVRPAEMTDTSTPLIPCEHILEAGALADALRYKRQYAKAQAMEAMYNDMLSNLIWEQENQPSYPKQFTPTTYNRDLL
jgi:hypothetical protein